MKGSSFFEELLEKIQDIQLWSRGEIYGNRQRGDFGGSEVLAWIV